MIQEDPSTTSDCVQAMTGACRGESFFREREGKRYCVLHLPDADKKEAFDVAVKKKLESQEFNYQEVWFPNGPRFSGIQIDKPVDFRHAVFNDGASFYNTANETMASATDEVGQPQKPIKALAYSLAVITLQRPDPRPLTATAWFAVLAETILGPIEAALLILAVRRRFMR